MDSVGGAKSRYRSSRKTNPPPMKIAGLPTQSLHYASLTMRGLAFRWTHAFTGGIVTWVVSNGIEASAHTLPWAGIADLFSNTGMSWKAALVQAFVHATWNAILYINRETGHTHNPFQI